MASALVTLTNLAANAVSDILVNGDQGEQTIRFITRPSRVTYALEATAATAELEVKSGQRSVQDRSAVDSSGTLGVMPNMQQKGQAFLAAAGEQLQFRVRETGGVATTDFTLFVDVQPIA
jgi:hypothetical protein